MATILVEITGLNNAGRKKHVEFSAEYGTDDELYAVWKAVFTAATQAGLEAYEGTKTEAVSKKPA